MRYFPRYNNYTGSVKSTLFFLQVMYWFEKMDGNPFYKFNNLCNHPFYKEGDSWAEELGYSVDEFKSSRKRCSSKLKLYSEYNLSKQNLVLFWSPGYNITYYLPNFHKMYALNQEDIIFEKDFDTF